MEEIERMVREHEESMKAPRTEADYEDMIEGPQPKIRFYEQDFDKGTPPVLVETIATPEDRRRVVKMHRLQEQVENDPDFDAAEYNRMVIDDLIKLPSFADLTQDLLDIKNTIKTKEEMKVLEAEAGVQWKKLEKKVEDRTAELHAGLRGVITQSLRDLIEDPDAAVAKADLQLILDKMPEVNDVGDPKFQVDLKKAMSKLEDSPAFQKKMAASDDKDLVEEYEKELAAMEKHIELAFDEGEDEPEDLDDTTLEQDMAEMDQLLHQMQGFLKASGGDSKLHNEIDRLLNEDPQAEEPGVAVFNREMDMDELAEELKKLAISHTSSPPVEEEAEEDVPADLQAKVDKIMEDPKLMEKLLYLQQLIEKQQAKEKADMTTIAHEVAPDPYNELELESTRITTLAQRIKVAHEDPEHAAALSRLRVRLAPPFNITPALKSFNQAIELAYIGANDDVRRVLWRTYQKARILPTFLQSLGDEAWDILYYSQAVTWGSNQNRTAHLKMLLADLKSLGRDGPPTHPSTLVQSGDGEHLET